MSSWPLKKGCSVQVHIVLYKQIKNIYSTFIINDLASGIDGSQQVSQNRWQKPITTINIRGWTKI